MRRASAIQLDAAAHALGTAAGFLRSAQRIDPGLASELEVAAKLVAGRTVDELLDTVRIQLMAIGEGRQHA